MYGNGGGGGGGGEEEEEEDTINMCQEILVEPLSDQLSPYHGDFIIGAAMQVDRQVAQLYDLASVCCVMQEQIVTNSTATQQST